MISAVVALCSAVAYFLLLKAPIGGEVAKDEVLREVTQ